MWLIIANFPKFKACTSANVCIILVRILKLAIERHADAMQAPYKRYKGAYADIVQMIEMLFTNNHQMGFVNARGW